MVVTQGVHGELYEVSCGFVGLLEGRRGIEEHFVEGEVVGFVDVWGLRERNADN
jgi:hypothetical protein